MGKNFVCLYRQTIRRIYTIFNMVHAMLDMNNIYQFQDIWRIFTRVRARTDRWTDGQTNWMHKLFSSLLENVKKNVNSFGLNVAIKKITFSPLKFTSKTEV